MKPLKLVAHSCALALLLGAALLTPAMAQAAPTAMKLSSRVFPSGALVPGGMAGTVKLSPGSSASLTAPAFIYQRATPPATSGTVYEFMFWDVNATLKRKAKATFTAPSGGSFQATAWYLPTGGGSCPLAPAPCPTAVTTWAFSLNSYKVLPGTPIQSVSPSSAWTSPSTSVSTATKVNITALDFLGAHTKVSFTQFRYWFVFGGLKVARSGLNLKVPAGESPYAIAFYYQGGLPPNPPCIGFPTCI